jgi:hypothetical protein
VPAVAAGAVAVARMSAMVSTLDGVARSVLPLM